MVKVMRTYPAPKSLEEEKKKQSGKYDCEDVIQQLKKDFHNKCYICETKDLQDPNVEHLLPHKNGKYPERKFDWDNLFWSCGHCNGIKNSAFYDAGIIDCCKRDPEECMDFRLVNDSVIIDVYDSKDDTLNRTANLVKEVFTKSNTGMRIYKSQMRLELLQTEMNVFYKQLEKLKTCPESNVTIATIKSMLRRESAYAAFKRCYVRNHSEEYPSLQQYIVE